jgi:hypothetical protein
MYDGPGSGIGIAIGHQQITGIGSLVFASGGTQTSAWTGSVAIAGVTGLQTALDGKQPSGTYATLVGDKVPAAQLPYATQSQAADMSDSALAMSAANAIAAAGNLVQLDMSQANYSGSGQNSWSTTFSGGVTFSVGSGSGVGSGMASHYAPAAWSQTLTRYNGSTGNFAGRHVNWTRRQRFRIRLVIGSAAPSANATFRVLLGKNALGAGNVGALAYRGIGFELRSTALWLTTHNGTSRTDTSASTAVAANQSLEFIVESTGSGTANLYVDGSLVATSSGAPTTVATDFATVAFVVEGTTTDSASSAITVERFPQLLRP